MKEQSLIRRDTFIFKIKNKILEIIEKIFGKTKVKEETNNKRVARKPDKDTIMKLYKDVKNNIINIDSLNEEQLKMLIKLADEEINILKYKIENEVTETRIAERRIRDYQQRLIELKK